MIIFDLDGTLADCEHRRHFVDPLHPKNIDNAEMLSYNANAELVKAIGWKHDWKSFYEACDQDTLIIPVAEIYDRLWRENDYYEDFEIWCGRCESSRKKTEKWLNNQGITFSLLKMRPKGNNTSDDQLKEVWLDEAITQRKSIDFVFDSHPESIKMWRRRGIFVFNCCQYDEEF